MHFLRGYDYRLNDGCALTIGAYDAVHRGHQAVISRVRALAKDAGLESTVVIFEPLPGEFFATPKEMPSRIYTLAQRLQIFRSLQIDKLICLRFCKQLAAMRAHEFTEKILVNALNVKRIVVGKDFHFGKDRTGNYDTLKELGQQFGFSVEAVKIVTLDGKQISSTRVRQALKEGDFDLVERLLGRKFSVQGHIATGAGLGTSKLGFPTANITCKNRRTPLRGVYAGNITLASGATHNAVINAGVRPTVCGKKYQLEAHILDFSGMIYGQKVNLIPSVKIRDEKHFESVDALKRGIAQDIETARAFFGRN